MNIKSNFDEKFIKRYYKYSEKRCILEVDVKYPKNLHDLPFFLWRIKIKNCNKLACNLLNKCAGYIKSLKQVLCHGLMLKKKKKIEK